MTTPATQSSTTENVRLSALAFCVIIGIAALIYLAFSYAEEANERQEARYHADFQYHQELLPGASEHCSYTYAQVRRDGHDYAAAFAAATNCATLQRE